TDKIQTNKNRIALRRFEHISKTDSSRNDSPTCPPMWAVAPRNFGGLGLRVLGVDSARRAGARLRCKARHNPPVKPIVHRVLRPVRLLPDCNCAAADN